MNFNEGAGRGAGRAQRRVRGPDAHDRRDHRAAPAAAARAGRAWSQQLHRARAHAAAFPSDRSPIPATTSSPRTATSSPAPTSSGRSCRSRSTASKWGADRPAFPLLQPEKVLSLPLQLRFDDGYRYRLAGSERDRRLRLLRRAVRAGARGQPRSTAARCGSTSRRSRASACRRCRAGCRRRSSRTRRRSATRRSIVGNRPVFLFSGLTARQIVLIAGRNLLVEKSVDVQRLPASTTPSFDRERASARESDRVMYRETDRGLRYFVKEQGTARRQRPADESREGDGDGRRRSIRRTRFRCRSSASTTSNFQFGSPEPAAGDAVRRRAGRRQHPAVEDRHDAARRQRRFLRDRRAVERSRLRAGR